MDSSDAEKYDNAINTLSQNQNQIKTIVKNQITLLQRSIQNFNKTTTTLAHNQVVLYSRILQIETIMKNQELTKIETYNFFLIQMILTQIISSYRQISDILEQLEIAITFAKINTLHNSMIQPNELLKEIESINGNLVNTKLPFKPSFNNILKYEKILEIKSYSKFNQIVFIIEIPLVEINDYDYFRLYPLPVLKQGTFQLIIPTNKYLILNENEYSFTNEPCKEINSGEFLCKEANPTKIPIKPPCEVSMLKYHKNITNCVSTAVSIKKLKIQRLELNKWLLITKEPTVIVRQCQSMKDNIPLQGTNLLEITPDCDLIVEDIRLQNHQNPKQVFKNIALPHLEIQPGNLKSSAANKQLVHLDTIDLNELNQVNSALNLQQQRINSISDFPVLHHNISYWTIILYIILSIAIIYICYMYASTYLSVKPKSTTTEQPNPEEGAPHRDPSTTVKIGQPQFSLSRREEL